MKPKTGKFSFPAWRDHAARVPRVGDVIELSEFINCDRMRAKVTAVEPDKHFPDETKIVSYIQLD